MKESPEKYKLKYPHHFSWEKQINLLEVGDRISNRSKLYEVKDIYRSPIKGKPPVIKLKEV